MKLPKVFTVLPAPRFPHRIWALLGAATICVWIASFFSVVPDRLSLSLTVLIAIAGSLHSFCLRLLAKASFASPPLWCSAGAATATCTLLLSGAYHVDPSGWFWYRVTGYNTCLAQQLPDCEAWTREELLRRYPQLTADPHRKNGVLLAKGRHQVRETLVIPSHLQVQIQPGAEIHFGPGCSLVSYGSVTARGTKQHPIVLTAANPYFKWGSVVIIRAPESTFEYVYWNHGRHARINDTELPGALSIVSSNVQVRSCRFQRMYGKDVIYVNRSKAVLEKNIIVHAMQDGIDLDSSTGLISHNLITDCDDDGIDVSDDSQVMVTGNTVLDRHGGRIAAPLDKRTLQLTNRLGFSQRG